MTFLNAAMAFCRHLGNLQFHHSQKKQEATTKRSFPNLGKLQEAALILVDGILGSQKLLVAVLEVLLVAC